MYFLLVELINPINCILISEEVPVVTIKLTERRLNSLRGFFLNNNNVKGNFYTQRPTQKKPAIWSFEKKNIYLNGEIILLKDEQLWHPFQNEIKAYEVNKVLFSGLTTKLSKITDDKVLLKATSGFFKIGNECYGGRINKV